MERRVRYGRQKRVDPTLVENVSIWEQYAGRFLQYFYGVLTLMMMILYQVLF